MLHTYPHLPQKVDLAIQLAAMEETENDLIKSTTCFPLTVPEPGKIGKVKTWVNDSENSEVYAKFRSLNAGLGNRYPTLKGFYSETCIFCMSQNVLSLNNEVHLVIKCPHFEHIRLQTGLTQIIGLISLPDNNSVSIYKSLMDDQKQFRKDVQKALFAMIRNWELELEKVLEQTN